METIIERQVNDEVADQIVDKLIQEQADQSIFYPNIKVKIVKDVDVLPSQKTQDILPSDCEAVKKPEIGLKSSSNYNPVEIRQGRNPAPFNPRVFGQLNPMELEEGTIATLAGQYTSDDIIDYTKPRTDVLNGPYHAHLTTGILSMGKEQQTELEAKLKDPVNFPIYDQLRQQVAININDPDYVRLSDVSTELQEQLTKSKTEDFRKPVETGWRQIQRREFVIPNPQLHDTSGLIARGLLQPRNRKRMTHDNVELVRKANETADFVENLFNTKFSSSHIG